jgi:hypothetical protein
MRTDEELRQSLLNVGHHVGNSIANAIDAFETLAYRRKLPIRITLWLCGIWLACIPTLFICSAGHEGGQTPPAPWVQDLMIGCGVYMAALFLIWFCRALLRLMDPILDAAFQTVPHPAEIEAFLWQQYGRQPSAQEVAAYHTMLTNQHNQDLINAGILLGGIALADHTVHNGGKIL